MAGQALNNGRAKPADWGDLPYFLAIARSGSLRAAAGSLHVNHATIARRLANLETDYAVRLFERSVDGLVLTQAGEELLPIAEQAEAAVLGARRKLSGLDNRPSGTVRITLPPSLAYIFVSPFLSRFAATYPDIDLDIQITNSFQDLTKHEADVSIRMTFSVMDDVVGRKVIQYAKGIYASRGYIEDHRGKFSGDGTGLTWIGWGDAEEHPEWARSSPFPAAKLRHDAPEGVMQRQLARDGMGMTFLPCFAADPEPELQRVPNTSIVADRSIWLLLHSDLRTTSRVRAFVDFMAKEILRQRPLLLGELG
jgi:DNA-binding transcriptional LysR family regulator